MVDQRNAASTIMRRIGRAMKYFESSGMEQQQMIELVRQIIDARGRLPIAAQNLSPNSDLYEAGLTSFAAIQIMLALEEALGLKFPEHMLRRQNFASINSIVACLRQLERKAA